MIKRYTLTLCILIMSMNLVAQNPTASSSEIKTLSNDAILDQPENTGLKQGIHALQTQWAKIKYQTFNKKNQIQQLKTLALEAQKLEVRYPNRAEPKIWHGIILSTKASLDGGLSALGDVKKAKTLFEQSITEDANALEGAAYTTLASLYYQVPKWPVGYGDNKKAELYFQQALAINPDGIDPNFFYGQYLIDQKRMTQARKVLMHALEAPNRTERPLADIGRRQEIKSVLAQLDQ